MGRLKAIRTSGGHRRYKLSDLEKFIGEYHAEGKETDDAIVATYARCSTSDQKQHGDIDRQSQRLSEYCAKKKYKVEYIIKDMGSGINDKRKGFVKLCKLITEKSFNSVNSYVCNRTQPNLETLLQISQILNVDLKDLIADQEHITNE